MANKKKYRKYTEAKKFVHSLGIKSIREWRKYCASGKKPEDIPSNPDRVYKEFETWPIWCGNQNVNKKDIIFLPFLEARDIVRAHNLKNQKEFQDWCRTKRPINIPADPKKIYGDEYKGFPDWIGKNVVAHQDREYISYEEFKKQVRDLNFQNRREFSLWHKETKPIDIPSLPENVYEQWEGWPIVLRVVNKWNQKELINFVKSLKNIIPYADPSELAMILAKMNLTSVMKRLDDGSIIKETLSALQTEDKEKALEFISMIEGSESFNDQLDGLINVDGEIILDDDYSGDDEITKEISPEERNENDERVEKNLANISTKEILNNLDKYQDILGISDPDTVEFLINKNNGRLWSKVLDDRNNVNDLIEQIQVHDGSSYSMTVKERFLEEYNSAKNMKIPDGYDFRLEGEFKPPNLMQKLITYRLFRDKPIGNWSGTGSGKTLGAILASRFVGSTLTIIIGLNNTILNEKTGWISDIRNAFRDSNILVKEKKNLNILSDKHNYLLLNYESFQLPSSRDFVINLLENYKIDMIVLDEVHSAKSSDSNAENDSIRRKLINYLLYKAEEKNPSLYVLGMSATPVVNNLEEAVSLLEMVKGRDYSELDTGDKLSSALAIHAHLVINGVRYLPNYKMSLKEEKIEIHNDEIYDDLRGVKKQEILRMEQILLIAKKDKIKDLLKPGTLIYTQYKTGMVDKLVEMVKEKNLIPSVFNGDDKTGLDDFIDKKSDVLIGTSALATGVNGLQTVCNRMIITSLPWTSAAYEQLVGRIYRQGSKFNQIEIFIPQITLNNKGDIWSWDKQRLNRIQYKKTLADAAVDGRLPEAKLIDRNKMLEDSRVALEKWLKRLEADGVSKIERAKLKIPLPPEVVKTNIIKYGDFSLMNQKINTSNSKTTNERFQKDPEEFYQYHTEYRKAREEWSEIPFEIFSERINKASDLLVVGDFGCGEALLSKKVRNKVYSFDHVAIDETVIACDISKIDLPDGILNICVFSLSLMGLNWIDYLKEANRLSAPGAQLMIAEPQNRWANEKLNILTKGIQESGFELLGQPVIRDKFIYINASKII